METIEEAAVRISKEHYVDQSDYWAVGVDSFKRGAKWQAEKMYSEEEVIEFHKWAYFKNRFEESDKTTKELLSEWFEQFKT